jgi:hypothetical protein
MPQNERELLEWYFIPSSMKSFGERVFSDATKLSLTASGRLLTQLANKSIGSNKLPENRKIDAIYWKFQNNKNKDFAAFESMFTQREVGVLIWTLDYLSPGNTTIILFSSDLSLALKLIQSKWKDSNLNTLWHILAKNWIELQKWQPNFIALTGIIMPYARNYTGKRNDILRTIRYLRYFEQSNSTIGFARDLISAGFHFNKANEFIEQRESVLSYSYFSSAFLAYLNSLNENSGKIDATTLSSIYSFLNNHNQFKTTLIAGSIVINSNYASRFQEIIKVESIRLISDPGIKHRWTSSELSTSEAENVDAARKKLNSWINKVFVTVFFEKLVQDERRKIYWLRFINKIDEIVFCGNRSNYQYLKNIQQISKDVDSRYKITDRNQSTCAIIIYSGEYVFVEFTDIGALYIYKKHSFKINLNNLNSTDDLKIWPPYKYACKMNGSDSRYKYYDTEPEGKIDHRGDWESKFNVWMRKYYDKY